MRAIVVLLAVLVIFLVILQFAENISNNAAEMQKPPVDKTMKESAESILGDQLREDAEWHDGTSSP